MLKLSRMSGGGKKSRLTLTLPNKDEIIIHIMASNSDCVQIGIDAPKSVNIVRDEIKGVK